MPSFSSPTPKPVSKKQQSISSFFGRSAASTLTSSPLVASQIENDCRPAHASRKVPQTARETSRDKKPGTDVNQFHSNAIPEATHEDENLASDIQASHITLIRNVSYEVASQEPSSHKSGDVSHKFVSGLEDTRQLPSPNRASDVSAAPGLFQDDFGEDSQAERPLVKRRRLMHDKSSDEEQAPDLGNKAEDFGKSKYTFGKGDISLSGAGLSTDPSGGVATPQPPTSRFAFSSSPTTKLDENEDDEESTERKKKLHQAFVKKLGRPDSIAEIKRRNWLITEETKDQFEGGAQDELEDEDEEEDKVLAKRKSKPAGGRKSSAKLTPMERQYLEIKRNHLDTIIVYEVGYKFKFFGEDARIAARELSIVCIPGKYRYDEHVSEAHYDRFASASIPVHRLHVHVKRLVAAGLKVGVVRQLETAALKAVGDNRNAPFVRKLTNLYTKGTYVDEGDDLEASPAGTPATGYLLCITETNASGWGTDEKVHVGLIAVQPSTGDVIHDSFEDGFMRSEIETRLLHIAPCEILIVGELSKASEKLLGHLAGSKTNIFGDKVRVDRADKPKTMAAEAFTHISNFYDKKLQLLRDADTEHANATLNKILQLPESITICLSAMISYLSDFGLEHVFDLTRYFQSFSARSHMLLSGTSLTSLEIYQNQTDHTERGSLFWTLNRTKTRFGQRLLRKWVGRPLLNKAELENRVRAVEELKIAQQTPKVENISNMLTQIKADLEKGLIRIYYGKCTRPESLMVLQTMQKIASAYIKVKTPADAGFQSQMINEAIAKLPTAYQDITDFLDRINAKAARENDKYAFFREQFENDEISGYKLGIAAVEQELNAHRVEIANTLRRRKVDYVTVAGIEYLVELETSMTKSVPASWAKISGTKKVSRFHTPETIRLIKERDQHKESLAAACDKAFASLLEEISSRYQELRDCVQALAVLDCLLSLSIVAGLPGYVKPKFQDEIGIRIEQGRHPMVEQLLLDNYVANDTDISHDATRAMLITGPNMGGKSSYVRQIALISVMGQIGSYVPAASAHLGIVDAVFTRMGAFDNMMAGESTFMVELSETADILKQATSRSLIILDELGRGTSTHDGVAIAHAVLDYLLMEKRSLVLFITHYQNLSRMANAYASNELKNMHMRFTEHKDDDHRDFREITFLYEVSEGVSHRSYGLNVARLANVPDAVLQVAAVKSKDLEKNVLCKGLQNVALTLNSILDSAEVDLDNQDDAFATFQRQVDLL